MWQLTIAVSKTFMMCFRFHNKHRIYELNGMDIVEQNFVRDLGVYIASDFSSHSHCYQVARKANIIAIAILVLTITPICIRFYFTPLPPQPPSPKRVLGQSEIAIYCSFECIG